MDVRDLLLGVTADGEIDSGEIRDVLKKLGTYVEGHPTPFAKMDATQVFFATMQLLLLSQISEKLDKLDRIAEFYDDLNKDLNTAGYISTDPEDAVGGD